MSDRDELVLGISDSHDAGVALVRGDQILAALNEERLSRKKMAAGYPVRCLEELWRIARARPDEVDRVAVAGNASLGTPPINNDFTDETGRASAAQRIAELVDRLPASGRVLSSPATASLYRGLMRPAVTGRLNGIARRLRDIGIRARVTAYNHHDCHVAAAYFTSGEPECLVVSNDGFGDGECSRVVVGREGRLELLSRNSFFNSLGVYYNYATQICGFPRSHHAGKTTGLAAFGDPGKTLSVFQSLLTWETTRGIYVNQGKLFRNCLRELQDKLESVAREDVAAGIQKHCEDVLTEMVRHYVVRTGRRRVALTGGVHANVKVNQRIAEIPEVASVFVFPNMGDGGLALGAAFLAMAESGARTPIKLDDVYLGSGFSEADIESHLRASGVPFSRPPDLAPTLARHLQQNRIVARFDGRMEYGPRALGNRSILYPATKPEVNLWLNRQLRRTEFMPFAPVIRAADAAAFFRGFDTRTAYTAEFMTITYDVTARCRQEAPAIVHVDGTARPQVLRRVVNPGYYNILEEYHRQTGLSVLVNTSFNMHEEPIVCSPIDAVKAFYESELDVLAIGPFLVENSSVWRRR